MSKYFPAASVYYPPMEPYTQIANSVLELHDCDDVVRSGHVLCGSYPDEPVSGAVRETVSVHSFHAIHLLMMLSEWCPALFTPDHRTPMGSFEVMAVRERAFSLMKLLMYHDYGEVSYGDRPDDGSQNQVEKDTIEMIEFRKMAGFLPRENSVELARDFRQFQRPTDTKLTMDWTQFYGELIQLARLCDKADAILKAVHLEKRGCAGDICYKRDHFGSITDRDRAYMEATGDSSTAAVWTAHFADHYHSYFAFREVIRVIRAAVIAVRGEWFPWWDEFCDSHDITEAYW